VRRSVRRAPAAGDSGAWYRIARSVMRRPVAYIVVIVIALLALGSPFRSITWGGTDARALPSGSAPRVVTEALARDFPVNATTPIEAVVKFAGPVSAPAERAALALVNQVRAVPAPPGAHVYVGGATAELVDELGSLGATLPWMALLVVLTTFVLL